MLWNYVADSEHLVPKQWRWRWRTAVPDCRCTGRQTRHRLALLFPDSLAPFCWRRCLAATCNEAFISNCKTSQLCSLSCCFDFIHVRQKIASRTLFVLQYFKLMHTFSVNFIKTSVKNHSLTAWVTGGTALRPLSSILLILFPLLPSFPFLPLSPCSWQWAIMAMHAYM